MGYVVGDATPATVLFIEAVREHGGTLDIRNGLVSSFLDHPGLPPSCTDATGFILVVPLESPTSVANAWRLWLGEIRERYPGVSLVVAAVTSGGLDTEMELSRDAVARAANRGVPLFTVSDLTTSGASSAVSAAQCRILTAHLCAAIVKAEELSFAQSRRSKHPKDPSASDLAEERAWVDRHTPAVFHKNWREFAARCIQHDKQAISLLCDGAGAAEVPVDFKASAPNASVEFSVTQLLAALDKGRSPLRSLSIRLDASESVCISMVVAILKHVRNNPDTAIRELWGEGGLADPQKFDALAGKLCASLPAVTTFGLRDCGVTAGATAWAALANAAPSLLSISLVRVKCSAQSPAAIAGLAAFLRDSAITSVTLSECGLSESMLQAIVSSLPVPRASVTALDLSANTLKTIPPQLALGLPSLRVVRLAGNHLDDRAATALAALSNIEELDLADNELTEFPQALVASQPTLWRLDIRRNNIAKLNPKSVSHSAVSRLRVCLFEGNPMVAELPRAIGRNNFAALRAYASEMANVRAVRWIRGRVLVQAADTITATEIQHGVAGLSSKEVRSGDSGVIVGDIVAKHKVGDKLELVNATLCRSRTEMPRGYCDSGGDDQPLCKLELYAVNWAGAEVLLGQTVPVRTTVVLAFCLAGVAAVASDATSKKPTQLAKSQLISAMSTVNRQVEQAVVSLARRHDAGIRPKVFVVLSQPDKCPDAVAADVLRNIRVTVATVPVGASFTEVEAFVISDRKTKAFKPLRTAVLADMRASVGRGLAVPVTMLERHQRIASIVEASNGSDVPPSAILSWPAYAQRTDSIYRDASRGRAPGTDGSDKGALRRLDGHLQSRLDAAVFVELGLVIASPAANALAPGAPSVCIIAGHAGHGQAELVQLNAALSQFGFAPRCVLTTQDGIGQPCSPSDAKALRAAFCTVVLGSGVGLDLANRARTAVLYATSACETGRCSDHDVICVSPTAVEIEVDPMLRMHVIETIERESPMRTVDRLLSAISASLELADMGRLAADPVAARYYISVDVIKSLRMVDQFVLLTKTRDGTVRHGPADTISAADRVLQIFRAHGLSFPSALAREDIVPRSLQSRPEVPSRKADLHAFHTPPAVHVIADGLSPWNAFVNRVGHLSASRLSADYSIGSLTDKLWADIVIPLADAFTVEAVGLGYTHMSTTMCILSLISRNSEAPAGGGTIALAVASWDVAVATEVFRYVANVIERAVWQNRVSTPSDGWRVSPVSRWPGAKRLDAPVTIIRTAQGFERFNWDVSQQCTHGTPQSLGVTLDNDCAFSVVRATPGQSASADASTAELISPFVLASSCWCPHSTGHDPRHPVVSVCIIHSAEDSRFAQAVADFLKEAGVSTRAFITTDNEDAALHSAGATVVLLSPTMLRSPSCLRQLQTAHRHGLPVTSVAIAPIVGDRDYDSIIGQAGRISYSDFCGHESPSGGELLLQLLRSVADRQSIFADGGFGRSSDGYARDVVIMHLAQDRQIASLVATELEERGVTGWLCSVSPTWVAAQQVADKIGGSDHVVLLNLHWDPYRHATLSGWAHRVSLAKAVGKPVVPVNPASIEWLRRVGLEFDHALLPQQTMDVTTIVLAILGCVEGKTVLFGGEEDGDDGVYIDVVPYGGGDGYHSDDEDGETHHRSEIDSLRQTSDFQANVIKRAERKARFKQQLYTDGGPYLGDPVHGAVAMSSYPLPGVLIPLLHNEDGKPHQTPKSKSRLAARKASREAISAGVRSTATSQSDKIVRPRFSPEKVHPVQRDGGGCQDDHSSPEGAAEALGLVLGPGQRAQASRRASSRSGLHGGGGDASARRSSKLSSTRNTDESSMPGIEIFTMVDDDIFGDSENDVGVSTHETNVVPTKGSPSPTHVHSVAMSDGVSLARASAMKAMRDFQVLSSTKLEADGEPFAAVSTQGAVQDTDGVQPKSSPKENVAGPLAEEMQTEQSGSHPETLGATYLAATRSAEAHNNFCTPSQSSVSSDGSGDTATHPIGRPRIGSTARAAAYLAAAEATELRDPINTTVEPPRRRGTTTAHISKLAKSSVAATVLQSAAQEKDHIADVLLRVRSNDPALEHVDISNVRQLKTMSSSERDKYFEHLAEALRNNSHVIAIKMNNVSATDFAAEEIADALAENTTLVSLSMETNDIRGPGVGALAATLRTHTSLRKLYLSNQGKSLPARAQHKLADAVETNERVVVCSAQFHDRTAADRIGKALLRNADRVRQARAARERESVKVDESVLPAVDVVPHPAVPIDLFDGLSSISIEETPFGLRPSEVSAGRVAANLAAAGGVVPVFGLETSSEPRAILERPRLNCTKGTRHESSHDGHPLSQSPDVIMLLGEESEVAAVTVIEDDVAAVQLLPVERDSKSMWESSKSVTGEKPAAQPSISSETTANASNNLSETVTSGVTPVPVDDIESVHAAVCGGEHDSATDPRISTQSQLTLNDVAGITADAAAEESKKENPPDTPPESAEGPLASPPHDSEAAQNSDETSSDMTTMDTDGELAAAPSTTLTVEERLAQRRADREKRLNMHRDTPSTSDNGPRDRRDKVAELTAAAAAEEAELELYREERQRRRERLRAKNATE